MPPATKKAAAKANQDAAAGKDSARDEEFITIPKSDLEAVLTRMLDERLAGMQAGAAAAAGRRGDSVHVGVDLARREKLHGGLDKAEVARLVRSDVRVRVPVRDKDGKPRRDKETKRIVTTVRQAEPGDILDFAVRGDELTVVTIDGRKQRFRRNGDRYRPAAAKPAPEPKEEDAA